MAVRRNFRNLDSMYFRLKVNDKWENVCFSDMTKEEQDKIMDGKDEKWLKQMCKNLAMTIREIGDQFDIAVE